MWQAILAFFGSLLCRGPKSIDGGRSVKSHTKVYGKNGGGKLFGKHSGAFKWGGDE